MTRSAQLILAVKIGKKKKKNRNKNKQGCMQFALGPKDNTDDGGLISTTGE